MGDTKKAFAACTPIKVFCFQVVNKTMCDDAMWPDPLLNNVGLPVARVV